MVCILSRVYTYYDQTFTVNATIVLFCFISLHRALHVSTTSGHPQVLQIFVYNYQTVTFTFTFLYMWFFNRSHFNIGLLKWCEIWYCLFYDDPSQSRGFVLLYKTTWLRRIIIKGRQQFNHKLKSNYIKDKGFIYREVNMTLPLWWTNNNKYWNSRRRLRVVVLHVH
jgi:hypothetical protein